MRRLYGGLALVLFLLMVPFANWLIEHYGIVPVGFGLEAPAAVYAVGVTFVMRDIVQRTYGRLVAAGVILAGAGLSYFVAPDFAQASALAFLAAEFADLAVFSAFERWTLLGAMLLSNLVGLLVDSYVFLTQAFGSLDFFWGQVVGKAWISLVAVAVIYAGRRLVPVEAA